MKMHNYITLEVDRSHTGKYWRYDVTACGLRRQSDDSHIDKAKTPKDVTCLKCKKHKICQRCSGQGTVWMGLECEIECPACLGYGKAKAVLP